MPVTFVLGRAGTGKTRYCLDALLAELSKPGESRRLILIVPEQASFQMERTLALRCPRHGYWRAEVLSFSRLARRVFSETGVEPQTPRETARTLALRGIAAKSEEPLRAFGPAARTPGLFRQLDQLIEELLCENVSPARLSEAAALLESPTARRRVAAIAHVYQAYLDWLGEQRVDPAQQLAVLRERLVQLDWLREASVWVDGFAGLTGQELETLVALAGVARDVAITLLLDPAAPTVRDLRRTPDVLDLFHRTVTTYQRLMLRLADCGVDVLAPIALQPAVTPRFAEAAGLAQLEAALATPIGAVSVLRRGDGAAVSRLPRPLPGREGDSRSGAGHAGLTERGDAAGDMSAGAARDVRVLECATHRDELRAAARFIRRQVMESRGALRFRDFAIIARNLEPFAQTVADVFAEVELPCFFDRRRSLGTHALARGVHALLEVVASDLPVQAMTRLLRCELLPLRRAEAETLENEITAKETRGFEAWQRPHWAFERAAALAPDAIAQLDRRRVRIANAFRPLLECVRADRPPTAANWARALHAALAGLRVSQRIAEWIAEAEAARDWETAEIHRLAWEALCGLLEDVHDVLDQQPLALAELTAIISAALGELTVGLAPPTLDQVLVSSIERSRHPDIKYAWVFAFNEGIFPAPPGRDLLLDRADRESLAQAGLESVRVRRDDAFAERLLAYIALTRPSHGLTISYAQVGNDGAQRYPSPILDEIRQILPDMTVEHVAEDEPPGCLSEFVGDYLRVRHTHKRCVEHWRRYEHLCDVLKSTPACAPALSGALRGVSYSNSPQPVAGYSPTAEAERGIGWYGSISEIERYVQCPFRHFAQHGLGLSALRGPVPSALELGNLAHEILAVVVEQAIAETAPVAEIPDGAWLAYLDRALQESREYRQAETAEQRPQAALLARALRPFLREVVLAHAERWRRGVFEPQACERRFGFRDRDDTLPALELVIAGGKRVQLRGVIDRIDRGKHGGCEYLVVYDYKSTPKSVKATPLTQDRLQAFAYLLALEQAVEKDQAVRVGGVFLAPLYPVTRLIDDKKQAGMSPEETRMRLFQPRGLFDETIAPLLDRELGTQPSPVAMMRLKKDGGFYVTADACPADALHARLDLARQTILEAAAGIIAGRIDIAPLVEGKTLACKTCEFGTVCRFEPVFNHPRPLEEALPSLRDVPPDESGGDE